MPECAPGDVPGWPLRVAWLLEKLMIASFLVRGSSFLVSIAGRGLRGQWRVIVVDRVHHFSRRQSGQWDRKPKCARSGTALVVQARAAYRTRTHKGNRARGRPWEAQASQRELRRPERPAGTAGRGDRRAATGLRRTTNEAFSARYLRACAVPHDGEKRRRIPRALPRACAVGVAAVVQCRKKLKMRCV